MSDARARIDRAYVGRRVLVTGGASFIGSHLTERLVQAGARVRVADDLSSGKLSHLESVRSDIELMQLDLRDEGRAARAAEARELVFHLAAAHGGRGYIDRHPVECAGNVVLDHAVFAAAARAGAEKIIFASSACVYPTHLQANESERRLLRESDANFDEPGKAFADTEYGWAKLMGELQLRAFTKQYGLSCTACRLFTAYGTRENESHAVMALIAKAALRLDPFPIWGNGLQTRNFTHVEDTVTGILLAGATLTGFDTINVGTDQHHTILELLEEIFRLSAWRPKTIATELDKPVGVKSRAADLEKCRRVLLWSPEVSLADGLTRTMRGYVTASDRDLERRLFERGMKVVGEEPAEVDLVLPVRNEAASIENTLLELHRELAKLGIRMRFVISEDGSTDRTVEILERLKGQLPIRLLTGHAGSGYSEAVLRGLAATDAPLIACLDSDGQCDPRDFSLLHRAIANADLVVGYRNPRVDPFARIVMSRAFDVVYRRLFEVSVRDPSCPYLLMRRDALERVLEGRAGILKQGLWWEISARASAAKLKICEVPVAHRPRASGVTRVYLPARIPRIAAEHLLGLVALKLELKERARTDRTSPRS